MKSLFLIIFLITTLIFNIACVNQGITGISANNKEIYSNSCSIDGDCNSSEICFPYNYTCKNKVTGIMNSKHKKIKSTTTQNDFNISNQTIIIVVLVAVVAVLAIVVGVKGGTKCCDGTTSSSTGRGTCSHHGGVC